MMTVNERVYRRMAKHCPWQVMHQLTNCIGKEDQYRPPGPHAPWRLGQSWGAATGAACPHLPETTQGWHTRWLLPAPPIFPSVQPTGRQVQAFLASRWLHELMPSHRKQLKGRDHSRREDARCSGALLELSWQSRARNLLPLRELEALLLAPMPQGQGKKPEAEDRTLRWLSSESLSGKALLWRAFWAPLAEYTTPIVMQCSGSAVQDQQ